MDRFLSRCRLLGCLAILSAACHKQTISPSPNVSPAIKDHRVYFVPIGDAPFAEIKLLVPHYQERLGITGVVLPAIKLGGPEVDTTRKQLIAENVLDSMVRAYPTYAADKSAVLIGITRQDMYPRSMDWRYCFGWRTENKAVVSTARMEWQDPAKTRDPSLLSTRLRKMVTKDIGVMYFGMVQNADPKSVLYGGIQGLEDLDQVGEDLYSKAASAVTQDGGEPVENDGSFPVWRISLEGDHGASGLKGALASRKLTVAGLQKENSLEVDLRSGKFVVQRTDLFVPDAIPLALTRSYYNFGQTAASSGPFGGGSSLNYDISPFGSRDPYTFIDLYVGDGNYLHFDRVSKGTGNEDAVYVHNQTSLFNQARFWWSGGGWTLGLPDGSTYLLPENYNGKALAGGLPMRCGHRRGFVCNMNATASGAFDGWSRPAGAPSAWN